MVRFRGLNDINIEDAMEIWSYKNRMNDTGGKMYVSGARMSLLEVE